MKIAQVVFCMSICINIRHLCQTSLFSFPQLDRQQKRRLDTFLDDGRFVGYMLLKFRPFLSGVANNETKIGRKICPLLATRSHIVLIHIS